MLIPKFRPLFRESEITPKDVYLSRRKLLAGLLLAPAAASAARLGPLARSQFSTTEKPNSLQHITGYCNFYEFGTQKDQPAVNAKDFKTSPWTVVVDGLCNKPRKFDLDQMLKLAPLEERIYRLRCVEAWSMVVPWVGYSLSEVLKQVEPSAKAKYVAFESYYDAKQMPLGRFAGFNLPYIEGLRLDEAMHPLTLLCSGLYGETLPPQNGAPLRLVVPWKYGFKSIKSIVRIRLTDKQPPTTWSTSNPSEYGFYSNVNPHVTHPRWSQASERRLGELRKRETLMFNGYGDHVASLYAGLDLKKFY